MKIRVRNAKFEDIDRIIEIKKLAGLHFREPLREKFLTRIKIFPEGLFIAESEEGIAGVSSSEIINFDFNNPPYSWKQISDSGWIKGTHNPWGNALYVVSVFVSPLVSGSGYGTDLMEAQKSVARSFHLKNLVLGARMPWYHKYPHLNSEEYASLKNEKGATLDPVLRFYEKCGLRKVKVIPDYMVGDKESLGHGALMVLDIPE